MLLFPHYARLPLLLGCIFSLRVLLLLRSPHISTKPSTVLLGRLALTDHLVLLHWMLQLGATLAWWMEEMNCEITKESMCKTEGVWWMVAVNLLCQQVLDAHHLASLLLLGLLGLEATLVSRWPQQTRRFRTSCRAQLSCNLVWILVLIELLFSLYIKLFQDSRTLISYALMLQNFPSSSLNLVPLPSLPAFSSGLRKIIWLVNLWLHYAVLYSKPQKRKSFFH